METQQSLQWTETAARSNVLYCYLLSFQSNEGDFLDYTSGGAWEVTSALNPELSAHTKLLNVNQTDQAQEWAGRILRLLNRQAKEKSEKAEAAIRLYKQQILAIAQLVGPILKQRYPNHKLMYCEERSIDPPQAMDLAMTGQPYTIEADLGVHCQMRLKFFAPDTTYPNGHILWCFMRVSPHAFFSEVPGISLAKVEVNSTVNYPILG